ncbi:MAG TPA: hypothetical protein VIC59_12010 [Gemmatimonadota bacterium]|jgi:hypothetical protein
MKGFFSQAILGRRAGWGRQARRGAWVAALALAGAVASCSDEGGPSGPNDTIPPEILIRQPADNTTVFAADGRPTFVIELSDGGTGIFDSSIQAVLDGRNVSDAFRNGFDEADGEIRLKSPIFLADGGRLLVLTVSDQRGNEARAQSRFVVTSIAPPPPDSAFARRAAPRVR